MGGPTIKRGESSGDIWTPWEFINAVAERFGELTLDLAASGPESAKAPVWITPEMDSLQQNWAHILGGARGWLNPPYARIEPWARKCAEEKERGAQILLLVPGSIGANWYWEWAEPYAQVYSVGRLTFDNCFDGQGRPVRTPYPKDLILCHYQPGVQPRHMRRWLWKKQ